MIFKITKALLTGILEEFKTGKSWKDKFLLFLRIILCLFFIGYTSLLFLFTVLTEFDGDKTEVAAMYIALTYMFFLIGNLFIPWKVISIKENFSLLYLTGILLSAIFYWIMQTASLIFHEGSPEWSSFDVLFFDEIFEISLVLFTSSILSGILFYINFSINHLEQKKKSLRKEWMRLSS